MKHVKTTGPWYREPWPWVLISLPATAVVAGFVTLAIAIENEDGLVAEDYYKQGLAINRVLERESRAAALGLAARIWFEGGLVRVELKGDDSLPPTLTLRFVHPTRAGEDQVVPLARVGDGSYQAQQPALAAGHWLVQLEDVAGTWRMSSSRWRVGEALTLSAADMRRGERRS